MALAAELVSEVEVVRCASGRLAEPAQRLDMVQRMGIYLSGDWQLLIRGILGYLGFRLSVLCYARGDDHCRGHHASR